jgi:dual specificity tyrosine-phosphorylation-regulated kinase 2/3/4
MDNEFQNSKIIDFGCFCFEGNQCYSYVQFRYYRSSEIVLGIKYGISIVFESFGCPLVELTTGYPFF